uniref:W2 domain-containing protein n=1 Tax=Chloropicon laureae TaxID=464258 RepID=A0A7S2Z565_9CHLO|mmetsp:Transcript_39203/g.83918  ORF Transcript_39203/g.83918 Transcript_39203/m.83918 type:complete len:430 (+) Transcript_39203:124-1413(+)|eukprot:CAMPEP_0197490070 /NCGR_PEP_ID=MMETSP1311-20131121/4708_1 /TAXON_ID=464262 /ORGANISM="Genus nov. species nov., Strain RCC856" /LENGTH=429 /DNA_ID=CAMNT_0043034519 /DNA_START=77 /DNA_END=1366 /DNA_ORIENTATION=+
MSTKEEKPTLGGVRIRQRKRNINVPLDPESFAKSLLEIFSTAKDEAEGDVDKSLELALGGIDQSDLDYNRYADTFFEVVFTGGILGTSSDQKLGEDDELKLNVLASEASREAQGPYIKFIQLLLRKKPFLVKGLEATLCKLLRQLEFFDEVGKTKLAIATALVFNNKLGPLPDKVMQSLLDDAKVNKGTSLEFLTQFCKEFLNRDPIEELDTLFKRARLDDKMLNFFPQQKRSIDHFNAYFTESGLKVLVDLNKKRFSDAQLRNLAAELKMLIQEEGTVKDALELVGSKIEELKLDEKDVLPVLWTTIMDSVQRSAKSNTQQQTHLSVLKLIKTWMKMFQTHCRTSRQELVLMNVIQVYCYEDQGLLKLYPKIIQMMYDSDVIAEDTILLWYKQGSSPKGRQVFLSDMQPFIAWLQEASEEEEDSSDEE